MLLMPCSLRPYVRRRTGRDRHGIFSVRPQRRVRWAATLCRCPRRAATPCPHRSFGGQPRSAGAPGGPPCHAPTGAFGGQPRSAGAPGEPLRHAPTGAFGGQPRSAGAPGGPPCHAPTGAFGGQPRSADALGGPLRHAPTGAFGGQPRWAASLCRCPRRAATAKNALSLVSRHRPITSSSMGTS